MNDLTIATEAVLIARVEIVCTCCGFPRDAENFPKNGDGKGGRRKQCKDCMQKINKGWRKRNKDKVSVYNKSRPKRIRKKEVHENQ